MNDQIIAAINSRNVIEFEYDGKTRKAEPYCYGLSQKQTEVLRAYQLAGYSLSGEQEGWKMFSVSKIGNLQETGDKFEPSRSGYNPRDKAIASIFAAIK